MYKLIGSILGWLFMRNFWGIIIGYLIGSVLDAVFNHKNQQSSGSSSSSRADRGADQRYSASQQTSARDSFLYSLMVLSAHIIQADGRIMHSEMDFVRKFLRANFDENVVDQCNEILLKLFDYKKRNGEAMWQKQILSSCYKITLTMPEEFKQQLMLYLCEIAKADGKVELAEIEALRQIAINIGIDVSIIDQALNMGGTSLGEAYKVLGITPDATDEDVKKAYKKMAQKYHPDLVANLGEDVQKAAEKKFQEIGNAKDMIFKSRGIKK